MKNGMVERMLEAAENDYEPFDGMTPEQYEAAREVEEQHEYAFKRDGMVAFFDVLGYSAIASTACEDVIRTVMEAVKTAQVEARQALDDIDNQEDGNSFQFGSDYDEIRCVNISDSLIFHDRFPDPELNADCEPEYSTIPDAMRFYRFLRFCRKVYGVLLEHGLPTRGAISIGTFYWDHESMLAGKPVIEAYKTSESLSFSGLVLSENSLSQIRRRTQWIFGEHFSQDMHFLKRGLKVYVKGRGGDELKEMDVVMPDMTFLKSVTVEDYVKMQFGAYGKSVTQPRVCALLKNTVDVLTQ